QRSKCSDCPRLKGTSMKQLLCLVTAALTMTILHGVCWADDKRREEKPRFKGVELYSWKDKEGNWVCVLGRVDIQPNEQRGELEKAQEVQRRFFVTSGDPTIMLDSVYKAFDDIAAAIPFARKPALRRAIAAGRNHRLAATLGNYIHERIAVVALVRDDIL